jgi:hypothetical protein
VDINLTLTVEEVNAVLHGLGQLPTSTAVFPLAQKIKAQAEPQIPKQEEEKTE